MQCHNHKNILVIGEQSNANGSRNSLLAAYRLCALSSVVEYFRTLLNLMRTERRPRGQNYRKMISLRAFLRI